MWIDNVQILFDGIDISQPKNKADYNPNSYKPIEYPDYVNKLSETRACTNQNKDVSAGTLKDVARLD